MTNREKVIQKAWDNENGLNKEVWARYWTYEKAKKHGIDKNGYITVCGYEPDVGRNVCDDMRPPQLDGIENNNNWTEITNSKDLPSDNVNYWVFTKSEEIIILTLTSLKQAHYLNQITHYQKAITPKKPLW